MKRFLLNIQVACLLVLLSFTALQAQELNGTEPVSIYKRDSVLIRTQAVDSSLVGVDVFYLLKESGVEVNRSSSVEAAFPLYLQKNAAKKLNGFRIRIFFDNKQTARAQSEEVEKLFAEQFPQYPVYRTYTNPYFKVAVGDFRTKSDAMRVLEVIKRDYPKAFIIKDVINYPQ